MPRHIVCLTYDFDALSLPIAKGTLTPTPLSRGEFGVLGVERIRRLLKTHRIRATFFVPGHTIETFPETVRALVDDGHEIACHGWTHRRPSELSRQEEKDELVRANEAIRKISGAPARGYRSPSWDLSEHTLDLLLELGFAYDSSLMGHDYLPYRPRRGDTASLLDPATFGTPVDLVEIPVSWSLDDYTHYEWSVTSGGALNQGLMSWRAVLDNWCADYDYMARTLDWGAITYTFHPFVSGRGHRMTAMEALIRHVRDHGAAFSTMEEIAAEAADRLGPVNP